MIFELQENLFVGWPLLLINLWHRVERRLLRHGGVISDRAIFFRRYSSGLSRKGNRSVFFIGTNARRISDLTPWKDYSTPSFEWEADCQGSKTRGLTHTQGETFTANQLWPMRIKHAARQERWDHKPELEYGLLSLEYVDHPPTHLKKVEYLTFVQRKWEAGSGLIIDPVLVY